MKQQTKLKTKANKTTQAKKQYIPKCYSIQFSQDSDYDYDIYDYYDDVHYIDDIEDYSIYRQRKISPIVF